jgi:hypothetical protein
MPAGRSRASSSAPQCRTLFLVEVGCGALVLQPFNTGDAERMIQPAVFVHGLVFDAVSVLGLVVDKETHGRRPAPAMTKGERISAPPNDAFIVERRLVSARHTASGFVV